MAQRFSFYKDLTGCDQPNAGDQFAQFDLMPVFMLSGFMFPFRGMPIWAQWTGKVFPKRHAVRIVRGMLLKGNDLMAILPEPWPMAVFTMAAVAIAVWFYRETLD